jgi:hypothetical protein
MRREDKLDGITVEYMTDKPSFARLEEVDLRDAWEHEAYDFTPWLAENLAYLSETIDMPLELVQREVPVGEFSADLLLRNTNNDTFVLVENQLETSNHSHLGQLLTYLQGLGAKTVVWIAPRFRDEHVSAIRWLNDNTHADFAFFAVTIKAVRIGGSPIAPLFEVIERPNQWDRSLHKVANDELTDLGEMRLAFWKFYLEMFKDELVNGSPTAASSRWRVLDACKLVVGQFITPTRVGIYVRGERGSDRFEVFQRLKANQDVLEKKTGRTLEQSRDGLYLASDHFCDLADHGSWTLLANWLFEKSNAYQNILQLLYGSNTKPSV